MHNCEKLKHIIIHKPSLISQKICLTIDNSYIAFFLYLKIMNFFLYKITMTTFQWINHFLKLVFSLIFMIYLNLD